MASARTSRTLITARQAGLVACQRCGTVHQWGQSECKRCHSQLESRDANSLQKVWALLITGIVAYIPANLYPMLQTKTLLSFSEDTIVGGVIDLIHYGSYGIAAIIFVASVLIPIGKFIAIAYLAISVQRRSQLHQHHKHRLFETVEFIGRWSMIDVFVVAILSALVQLGGLATINPGIAALSFALSVVFTMLAAQSFDARMIWDSDEK